MPSTLLFMVDLEHYVEHVYLGLSQNVYNTRNLNILFHIYVKNVITNKRDAVNIVCCTIFVIKVPL